MELNNELKIIRVLRFREAGIARNQRGINAAAKYDGIESDEDGETCGIERREAIAAAGFFVKRPYVHRPRYYAVAPLRFPFG